jgi:hypothetical protein
VEVGDQVIECLPLIFQLQAVWDLKMQGAERIDVEHRYQLLTGGRHDAASPRPTSRAVRSSRTRPPSFVLGAAFFLFHYPLLDPVLK